MIDCSSKNLMHFALRDGSLCLTAQRLAVMPAASCGAAARGSEWHSTTYAGDLMH